MTDRVDSEVEAYRREPGLLDVAALPKPVEREVDIAQRDAHHTQVERRNERGARQPFRFHHASSRFASVAAVLVLIYVLVVGWFQSFKTPLLIMAPIPFSLVGVLPAHAAMGAFFTATSMIGFIAGAGIVVRNSIILVDFIELRLRDGLPLEQAVATVSMTLSPPKNRSSTQGRSAPPAASDQPWRPEPVGRPIRRISLTAFSGHASFRR
jgi:hypothetical protein